MPKVKKLTKKQRGFLKDYEATGNAMVIVARNHNTNKMERITLLGKYFIKEIITDL